MNPGPSKSKERASRISLKYYSRPDAITRIKLLTATAATIVVVAWIAWGAASDSRGVVRYSHGPLSNAHSTWETQCSVCHVDFHPIRTDAWAVSIVGRNEIIDLVGQRCSQCSLQLGNVCLVILTVVLYRVMTRGPKK